MIGLALALIFETIFGPLGEQTQDDFALVNGPGGSE